MGRREDRQKWRTWVARDWKEHEGRSREFWLEMSPQQRLDLMWDLTLEYFAIRPDAGEPRLQRSAGRVERR